MNGSLKEQSKAIKEEFCFEKLSGSKIIEVNKQKILSKLYSELRNLANLLKEWIERAARIVIYYHDENVIGSYIKNLVAMFGKKEFDNIRKNKNLLFVKNPIITFIRKTYD